MRWDSNGRFWDYALDAVFIAIGIKEFIKNLSWSKTGWLTLDIVLAIIPVITALSSARHLNRFDDLYGIHKLDKIVSGINHIDNVLGLMKVYGHIDNFADTGGVI